jgi:DNA invertase Pin-like site-specific DNA recombinase
MAAPSQPIVPKKRCAIYTRKSTDEGLDQEYNSLEAQRDAGLAFVASQRHEGWVAIGDGYDDGGYSGGNLDRPGLKRLMADIEAGEVDIVVVYKIDRLTRALSDFAKLVDVFDRNGVLFVSVTQQFNTTTSMGRLTLNILLSFAQFEREVTGERIRDKIAASKARGMWMGGMPPLGYDVVERKLIVNTAEAELVRGIFCRYAEHGSAAQLVRELAIEGQTTKSWVTQGSMNRPGRPIDQQYFCHAAQPHLPWRDGAQRQELSGAAPSDRFSRTLECSPRIHRTAEAGPARASHRTPGTAGGSAVCT